MAVLLKTGITTGESVEAWHITQSIDAFSGLDAYDITLSGSLTLQNGTQQNGGVAITDANGLINFIPSSSFNTGSFTGSFTGNGSGLTGITASVGPNFSNTDLTFTGNRAHNTSGSFLEITTDGGLYDKSWIYIDNTYASIGWKNNYINSDQSKVEIYSGTVKTQRINISGSTGMVINDFGADYDFRIEGDTDANLFFVDASTDRIGIGKLNPNSKLDINGNTIITGSLTVTKAFMHDGIITSTGSVAPSDPTLKVISTWVINITGSDVTSIGDGNIGQRLLIYVESNSGTDMTITPNNTIGYSSITLTNVGESIELY